MGELLDDGSALGTSSETVKVTEGKWSTFPIVLEGDATSGNGWTIDQILDVSLKRHLPGSNSRKEVIDGVPLTQLHRVSRYEARGSVDYSANSGGSHQIVAFLDMFVPTLPGNVAHITDPEDCRIKLSFDITDSNWNSLSYEVHGVRNPAGVEYYVRRMGQTDLDLNGGDKDRQPTGNIAALYLLDKSSIIADEGINVDKYVGGQSRPVEEDQSFDDIERVNQRENDIPDSGLLDPFTKVLTADGTAIEDHTADYVDYEIGSSGNGKVYVLADEADFGSSFNGRSSRQAAQRARALRQRTDSVLTAQEARMQGLRG